MKTSLALLAALLLCGCAQEAQPPASNASGAAKSKLEVEVAPQTEANNIAEWVEKGVSVHSKVLFVKSKEHQDAYWAAARLYGPGLSNTWAIFGRGGTFVTQNDPSSTEAVDAVAVGFSDAPDGCSDNSGLCWTASDVPRELKEYAESLEPNDAKFQLQGKLIPGRSKGRSAEQAEQESEAKKRKELLGR